MSDAAITDEKRAVELNIPPSNSVLEANMSETLQRAKVWALTHSGLIVAVAFVAIAVAAFALSMDLGLAGRSKPRP